MFGNYKPGVNMKTKHVYVNTQNSGKIDCALIIDKTKWLKIQNGGHPKALIGPAATR